MTYIMLGNKDKSFLSKIIDRIFLKVDYENIDGQTIVFLDGFNSISYKKIKKFMEINCIKKVCIAEDLRINNEFIEILNNEKISFFNGKWIFKYMIYNIIEYILDVKKDKIELQEISILANDINENILDTINELALNVKNVNIITNNKNKFSKLEKLLFDENGIILNISNNYDKSLAKSNFVINYDFGEEELNRYNIYQKACLINVNKEVTINSKSFDGVIVNSINISLPSKYITNDWQKQFNNTIMYESLIYKNTSTINIKKEIKADSTLIDSLNGLNGIINKKEYLKLSKKA